MVDYLISNTLTGEESMDAKHVSNYVLGSRPEPSLLPWQLASSKERLQASTALPGEHGAPACRSGEESYF